VDDPRDPAIFRGPVFPDLFYVGAGCYVLGNIAGFFVGSLLHPFVDIDPTTWGRWAAGYAGVFGVALVLLSRV
jgi:hypothetical protein